MPRFDGSPVGYPCDKHRPKKFTHNTSLRTCTLPVGTRPPSVPYPQGNQVQAARSPPAPAGSETGRPRTGAWALEPSPRESLPVRDRWYHFLTWLSNSFILLQKYLPLKGMVRLEEGLVNQAMFIPLFIRSNACIIVVANIIKPVTMLDKTVLIRPETEFSFQLSDARTTMPLKDTTD